MSTKIETPHDLKAALLKIVEALDERQSFFGELSHGEKYSVERLGAQLEKMRNEAVQALSEHYAKFEKDVDPLLGKIRKLALLTSSELSAGNLMKSLPSRCDISCLADLAENLERLNEIKPETWELLRLLADKATGKEMPQ